MVSDDPLRVAAVQALWALMALRDEIRRAVLPWHYEATLSELSRALGEPEDDDRGVDLAAIAAGRE